jgi:hypothetical protein
MIDPATGWFKIVEVTNKSATSIQDLFHNTWLARYQWRQFIVFDNGSTGEFKLEFKQMCIQENYGIKAKPTTSHKPELTTHNRMQSLSENTKLWDVNNILRLFDLESKSNHENLETQEVNPYDYFLHQLHDC